MVPSAQTSSWHCINSPVSPSVPAKVELNNGASAIGVSRPGYTAEQAAITQLNNAGLVSSANPIKAIYIAHSDPTKTIQPSEQDISRVVQEPAQSQFTNHEHPVLYPAMAPQWHPIRISKPLARFLPIPFSPSLRFCRAVKRDTAPDTISPGIDADL
ncbi:MAG: hypothetical protein R2857_11770 [Vampirovibrionales bacterium]